MKLDLQPRLQAKMRRLEEERDEMDRQVAAKKAELYRLEQEKAAARAAEAQRIASGIEARLSPAQRACLGSPVGEQQQVSPSNPKH